MIRRTIVTTVLVVSALAQAAAQNGSIYGSISDKQSGEMLVGANISIAGSTMGAVADLDGKYSVKSVPPGTYNLRVSFVGYGAKTVTGVEVKAGASVKIDVDLAPQTVTTEEVVITAERQVATESAVLSMRKKSASIGDGFSAEQVKNTPDATTGDALRRVTGIAVVDNKFVYVRGVPDRYNSTLLNGIAVTSTDNDVDKKSFSFDLIPANLVQNTIVTKTVTPDKPGDFSGGLVEVNTLEFPTSPTFKVMLGGGYQSLFTTETAHMTQGGARDWTGFDDGTRDSPPASLDKYAKGKALKNNWTLRTAKAPLLLSTVISGGRQWDIGENQLGVVGALSYKNGYTRKETDYKYYSGGSRINDRSSVADDYNVLWGVLADVNFKTGLHKFTWKNNFNQSARDRAGTTDGINDSEIRSLSEFSDWNQRTFYLTTLSGAHVFPSVAGMEALWQMSFSTSRSKEPDRRWLAYGRNDGSSAPYTMGGAERSWAELDEDTRGAGVDFTFPLGESKFRFGLQANSRKRDYNINVSIIEPDGLNTPFYLYLLPPDSVFLPQCFGPNLWKVSPNSEAGYQYSGDHVVVGSYLMVDLPFAFFDQLFRFAGGVRLENSDITVRSVTIARPNQIVESGPRDVDWLPSFNLTYIMNENTNIRLAYSHSVNRPEMREVASYFYYDYAEYENYKGNPDLVSAEIRNYDARVEFFPGPGEVLAASYFFKNLKNPIEGKLFVSSNPTRSFYNSPKASNSGWEVEVRKTLGFLGGYFSNILIGGNYTRVESEVVLQEDPITTRELQGQSPYTYNVFFQFREPVLGTTLSLWYYAFGRRLDTVGDDPAVDIFEEPRGIFDVALNQSFPSGVELKFTIRDLDAGQREFFTRQGDFYKSVFTGTAYSFQVSYNF